MDKHVCVCVVIPFILNVRLRLVGVPKGVTQEEAHTGFLHVLSVVVLALIFLARRIQPFLPLVDREVDFRIIMCTNELVVLHLLDISFIFIFYFFCEEKSQFV